MKGTIGDRIKYFRELKGTSQKDLARSVGMSQSYFSQLESGTRNIDAGDLEKIAIELQTPIDRFFPNVVKELPETNEGTIITLGGKEFVITEKK